MRQDDTAPWCYPLPAGRKPLAQSVCSPTAGVFGAEPVQVQGTVTAYPGRLPRADRAPEGLLRRQGSLTTVDATCSGPWREGAEIVYQFEMPFVVDPGKYTGAFGEGEATPYREGIRRTVDWYRRNLVTGRRKGGGLLTSH